MSDLVFLEHTLQGRICVSRIDVLSILVKTPSQPIRHVMTWLGHESDDIKLGRTVDGRGLLSKSLNNASMAWSLEDSGSVRLCTTLSFHSSALSVVLLAGNTIK
jgi:hypothetical protein